MSRAWTERLVRAWWAGRLGWRGRVLSAVTLPLEAAWRLVTFLRNAHFDFWGGRAVERLEVVSVGNLAVGGTGKTPVAAWIARCLRARGAHPALVVRGYGHDEVLLHRRWNPAVPVVVDRDRVAGAERARAGGADVVVLDDGFQHRRLRRSVDVVLLAAEDAFPSRVLPRGPYREPAGSLARADGVLITRRTAPVEAARTLADAVERLRPGLVRGALRLAPGGWLDLEGGEADLGDGPLLAVTAVARPEAFADTVRSATGREVELLAFRDHHEYGAPDLQRMSNLAAGRTIVVTEKDAVKLAPQAAGLGRVRVLALQLEWDWGEDAVRSLVAPPSAGAPVGRGGAVS